MDAALKRLKEPSTGAGIAALAALFAPSIAHIIPEMVTHGVGLLGAVWAVMQREGR